MEAWVAKMADADAVDSQASMGPYIASTERTYWTQLNALSRLPTSEALSPLITLTTYHVKPGSDAALRAAITKVNAALDAGKFPLRTIWYVLTKAAPAPPTPSSHRGRPGRNGAVAVAARGAREAAGQTRADALVKSFFDNVVSANTELLRLRTDLSYLPK
jgi:hypothetical protein